MNWQWELSEICRVVKFHCSFFQINVCKMFISPFVIRGKICHDTCSRKKGLCWLHFSFMYTGKLEFRTELHRRLYTTAQQMNMTVLTKLLDAQNSALSPQARPVVRRPSQVPITYNLQGKKIAPKQIDPDLPETLPGRKYVLWFKTLPLITCMLKTSYTSLDKGWIEF